MRSIVVLTLVAACGGRAADPGSRIGPAAPERPRTDPLAAPTYSTLALFEEVGRGCAFRRVDPVAGTSIELARFPGACVGARVSWRRDLTRALIWFDPFTTHRAGFGGAGVPAPGHPDEESDQDALPRLFEVELATGATRQVAMPELADPMSELGYGPDGALLAFATHDLPDGRGKQVSYLDHPLDFHDLGEGMAAAACVYREEAGGWKLGDVVASTTGWDYAAEWHQLPIANQIGPRSIDLLEPHADTHDVGPTARAALARIAAGQEGDDWTEMTTSAGPLYVWQISGEFIYTTGRIAWRGPTGAIELLPGLGFTAGELVSVTVRGRFLLVAGSNAGAYPRLYDLAAHERVFASDSARAATLWPLLEPALAAAPE